jgi:hypothetical protein
MVEHGDTFLIAWTFTRKIPLFFCNCFRRPLGPPPHQFFRTAVLSSQPYLLTRQSLWFVWHKTVTNGWSPALRFSEPQSCLVLQTSNIRTVRRLAVLSEISTVSTDQYQNKQATTAYSTAFSIHTTQCLHSKQPTAAPHNPHITELLR